MMDQGYCATDQDGLSAASPPAQGVGGIAGTLGAGLPAAAGQADAEEATPMTIKIAQLIEGSEICSVKVPSTASAREVKCATPGAAWHGPLLAELDAQ